MSDSTPKLRKLLTRAFLLDGTVCVGPSWVSNGHWAVRRAALKKPMTDEELEALARKHGTFFRKFETDELMTRSFVHDQTAWVVGDEVTVTTPVKGRKHPKVDRYVTLTRATGADGLRTIRGEYAEFLGIRKGDILVGGDVLAYKHKPMAPLETRDGHIVMPFDRKTNAAK